MNLKLIFNHSLGDCIQFNIVLNHLKYYRPDCNVTLWVRDCYQCLFDLKWFEEYDNYHSVKQVLWFPGVWHPTLPATKTTRCLKEMGIEPDINLYSYSIPVLESPNIEMIKSMGKYVLIHARGVSAPRRKNMSDVEIVHLFNLLKDYNPIMLDKADELGHLELRRIVGYDLPFLYNIINHSFGVYGIDSGVSHLSCALNVPTVIYWKGFLPTHNIEPHACLTNYISDMSVQRGFWDDDGAGDLDYMYNHYSIKEYNSILDIKEIECPF